MASPVTPGAGAAPTPAGPSAAPAALKMGGDLGKMMAQDPDYTLVTSDGVLVHLHRSNLMQTSSVFRDLLSCMADCGPNPGGLAAVGDEGPNKRARVEQGGQQQAAGAGAVAATGQQGGGLKVQGTAAQWRLLLPYLYPSMGVPVLTLVRGWTCLFGGHLMRECEACMALGRRQGRGMQDGRDELVHPLAGIRPVRCQVRLLPQGHV